MRRADASDESNLERRGPAHLVVEASAPPIGAERRPSGQNAAHRTAHNPFFNAAFVATIMARLAAAAS